MELFLKVLRVGEDVVANDLSVTLGVGGGTIGRAQGNDLELPDEEGDVSRVHAKIEKENDSFFIIDCSCNGTILLEPVLQGSEGEFREIFLHENKKQFIEEGAYILIGSFEILAQYHEDISIQADEKLESLVEAPFFSKPSAVQEQSYECESNAKTSEMQASFSISEAKNEQIIDEMPEAFNIDDFFNEESESLEVTEDILAVIQQPDIDKSSTLVNDKFSEEDQNEQAADLSKSIRGPISEVNLTEDKPVNESYAENTLRKPQIEPKQVSEHIQQKNNSNVAFFKALDIDVGKLSKDEKDLEQLMFNAGLMLKAMLESQMTLLKARENIKKELPSSMTVVQKEENNPLKFFQSVDEVLTHFFINPSPGFLSGQSAVDESSDDLCTHQMAMMSGIQCALRGTIRVFDPDILEKSSDVSGFNKGSKYWEFYVSHYKKLSKEAQAEFFGDDFSDAYEKQVRAMKNSR